ncbi:DNA methyltransferase [Bernardetia sp. OM2101]|uniref:DNA methyltransferase n=1 Tax=Bernardetia sp. OM2101 TaxID=3344876 RepID=UPI0035CF71E4
MTQSTKSQTYNMDCVIGMKDYPDNHFDLAILDPPFGINAPNMSMGTNKNRKDQKGGTSTATKLKGRLNTGSGKLKNRILNKSLIEWDNETPSEEYWKEVFRVSKHQIIFGGNYFDLPPTRGIICWDKKQPWENFSQFELAWTSYDKPAKVFRLSSRGGNNKDKKIHPTQKPIELYEWLLLKYAKEGYKILDTHLGSGSSRIACYKHGFDFTGFEISKIYFDASEERFNQFKQHNPILLR